MLTVPDGGTIYLCAVPKVLVLGDISLLGGLFRGAANSDIQKRLYVSVKAEIIRPTEVLAAGESDLERISQRNRAAIEGHETQLQELEIWPGVKPQMISPERVRDDL